MRYRAISITHPERCVSPLAIRMCFRAPGNTRFEASVLKIPNTMFFSKIHPSGKVTRGWCSLPTTDQNRKRSKSLDFEKRFISEQTFMARGLTQRSVSQARSRILCAEMFCLLFLGSWGLGQVNSQISSEGYMMHTPWRFELLNLRFTSQTGSLLLCACKQIVCRLAVGKLSYKFSWNCM